ncbi:hypothetical protein GIB67_028510 [Kingdonia uniflora]|uniref:MYB-CC type transcription factor LHEQLE-containing domain-containing protein n=1 Tax=Kingdonia uniflora TaxID=39325 RepID=A0A7J7KVT9_9MAGN|nr:hypothetical protein GIB67_028510 [Kingdonia uniflora]
MPKTEMDLQIMQDQQMSLVLSTDAKPRLKWTSELHKRFVEAVTQLGGATQATPKSLLTAMSIPGLTLYHLKSHLQAFFIYYKYRLVKNQQLENCNYNDQEESTESDYDENEVSGGLIVGEIISRSTTRNTKMNDLEIAQALHAQMEVQKKLHEQIEVQRHLQLRIEAQGMYLQSILKKAQETLAGYNSSSLELEPSNAHVLESVSLFHTGCPNSSISGLTEAGAFNSVYTGKRSLRGNACSIDSSLTSSETSGIKNENLQNLGRKRSRSIISDETSVDQRSTKRLSPQEEKPLNKMRIFGLSEDLDLNRKYQSQWDSALELKL